MELSPAGGVCPRCAAGFLRGTPTEPSAARSGKHAFTPPTVTELAAKFPQFEILAFVGQGGMGAVYKALQRQLDRVVALKILPPDTGEDPTFAERFAREAKALARLNHPGIVTIHDFGRADGLFYFLMEFVDGVSLGQLMQGGRVSPREALAIVPQICDALQYAHDQGLVHRDIKPENILLDRLGRVKVADFGLVKLIEGIGESTTDEVSLPMASANLTETGKLMGTPQYMAPEQVRHPAEVDHRADIYALGVVFYQMLTGELPSKPLQAPSKKFQVDVRLDEVVLRALEADPGRRYQQASQIKTAIETVASTPIQSQEKGKTPLTPASLAKAEGSQRARPSRPVLRTALTGIGLLLGVALLAFVAAWFAYFRLLVPQPPSMPLAVYAYPASKGDVRVYLSLPGSVVSSNSVVFSIAQSWVQDFARKFNAGERLPVRAYASGGGQFGHGFVMAMDNKMDPATGTLKCTASLVPEQPELMIPGMYLNIRVLGEVKPEVVRIPAEAIEHDQRSAFVWVITPEQTVVRKTVVVGTVEPDVPIETDILQPLMARRAGESNTNGPSVFISEQWAEIHSGVSPGELVVVRPDDATLQRSSQYGWKVRPEPVGVDKSFEDNARTGTSADHRELLLAQYHQAETEFVRLEKLHDLKAISDAEFERAQERMEVLKATLDGDPIRAAQIGLESADRRLQRLSVLFTNNLVSISELEAAQLELQKRRVELKAAEAHTAFGAIITRTLRINDDQCDFLVLRTGEVLQHPVGIAEIRDETPLTPFMQWVRSNRVDIGFCFSTNKFYPRFGLWTLDTGTYQFPSDTVPLTMIPRFSSVAEWLAYNAQHAVPAERPLVGPLVGVTNIWNDLKAAQLEEPPEGPAFFLKEKHFAMCFPCTNSMPPIAFSTREGLRGVLQVTAFNKNPPSVSLRYKLVSYQSSVEGEYPRVNNESKQISGGSP